MAKQFQQPLRGRGAASNPDERFQEFRREWQDDGWGGLEETMQDQRPVTELIVDSSRSIISYNDSPDVPFDRSINPYRGCEHGCVYCFARPTHAWLGLSPGLDFETRIAYKADAPALLRKELAKSRYRCAPLMLGINTDAYQPAERHLQLTRQIIKVLAECGHPFAIVTKSDRILRDVDLLAPLAERNLVQVAISITSLDHRLSRRLEPRTAMPQKRLEAVRVLSEAGIPVGVLAAPLIPALTDHELEAILNRAREAGARYAGYILLRLPHEVKGLFMEWLQAHAPLKAEHVMARIRDCRGGREYDATFGRRMRGEGPFAELIAQRFRLAMKRLDFPGAPALDCSKFMPPVDDGAQMNLF